jgi:hypothetical protein
MAQDLGQLQQQITDLRREYTRLTAKPAALFQVSNIDEANSAIQTLTRAIADAQDQAAKLEAGFGGIKTQIEGIVRELTDSVKPINLATSAFRKMQSSVEKLKYDQQGISRLNRTQLEQEQKKQKIYQQTVRDQALSLIQDKQSLLNDRNGNALQGAALSQRLRALVITGQITEQEEAVIRAAKQGFKIFDEVNKLLDTRLVKEKQFEKALGLSGKAAGLFGKIPFFGGSAAEALRDTEEELRRIDEAGKPLPNRFQTMLMLLGKMKGSIKQALTDPLTLLVGFTDLLIKGFNKFDQAVVGVQKRLALSKEEAGNLVREFTTFNTLLTSADLLKSIGAIQDKLGSVGKVSQNTAETFARLNTYIGLSEEGAAGLVTQSDAFGKKASDNLKTAIGTTAQVGKQYRTNLDYRKVLEAVGKASSYTLVQFKGSTEALTEGVAKANALGISLETVNKSAQGLLNFQQSIEDELAAEVLSGKQLNLEQARYYALTNQQSKLMDELNSQIGTYSDFTKQTVFAQEAQAKALGMSVPELSDMLFKQEYMKNTAQEQVLTEEELIQKRLESLTVQQKLEKATERISELFANFVAGPLGTFLTDIRTVSAILGFIAGSQITKIVTGMIPLIIQTATWVGGLITGTSALSGIAAILTGGAAVPLILGTIGAVAGALAATKADDLFSAGAGSGYGNRVLLAPEGAFALNDRDDIVAGPGVSRGTQNLAGGGQSTVNNQVSVAPSNTRINLNLNGAAIGNATARQDYTVGRNIRAFGGSIDYSAPI